MCDLAWFTDVLDSNPAERAKRDLIVAYAESEGGLVLDYLQLLFPRYWFMVEDVPAGTEAQSLGLTEQEEMAILADLFTAVLPSLQSSPGRAGRRRAGKPTFPTVVRHARPSDFSSRPTPGRPRGESIAVTGPVVSIVRYSGLAPPRNVRCAPLPTRMAPASCRPRRPRWHRGRQPRPIGALASSTSSTTLPPCIPHNPSPTTLPCVSTTTTSPA
jgi:hypothetical protein